MRTLIRGIERAYPGLLIAPVLLPVVIWGSLIYPYLVPKTLVFYAISFVSLGAFALLATHEVSFYWGRLTQRETWIPAALLVLAYIASALGIDFYRSFWSLLARGDGLLMLTCAVSDFYLIVLYADRTFFEKLLRSAAVVATLVALYGIYESLTTGGRIGSLLGNAGFFAGYLGIAFFATLAATRELDRGWRRIALIGAGLQLVAIVLTATRGTMLALVIAGVAYLLYEFVVERGPRRVWSAGILIGLIAVGGLFISFRNELAHSSFSPVARVASIGVNDPDVASRLFIWKNMVTEIEKSPLLGVGAEHIDVLFNRFYDPTQIYEQWFDRSHNAFLDYAAQYGIGGFLLYLALIAAFFTSAARLVRKGESRLALIFSLLALTYSVSNFFIFDTVSSFWLFLALLAVVVSASLEQTQSVLIMPAWTRYASYPFALILLLLLVPVSIRPALAAYDLSQAFGYQVADVAKEVGYLSRGFALGTYGSIEFGYEAYDMYVNNQAGVLSGNARTSAYESTLAILKTEFNQFPYDARTAIDLAHVLSLAPPGVATDSTLLETAVRRSVELSPKRMQAWYILVNVAIENANRYPAGSPQRVAGYAAAKDLLTRYIELVPTLSEPHFALADLEFAAGDTLSASVEAAQGKTYYRSDLATARRASGYYENAKDWTDGVYFLTEVTRLAPDDHASLYDLAKVTYLSGDKAGAETIVASLKKIDPSILASDQNFLAAITVYEQTTK